LVISSEAATKLDVVETVDAGGEGGSDTDCTGNNAKRFGHLWSSVVKEMGQLWTFTNVT
jgi:hypothetical protein